MNHIFSLLLLNYFHLERNYLKFLIKHLILFLFEDEIEIDVISSKFICSKYLVKYFHNLKKFYFIYIIIF